MLAIGTGKQMDQPPLYFVCFTGDYIFCDCCRDYDFLPCASIVQRALHFHVQAATFDHTVRGALSTLHTSRAPGLEIQQALKHHQGSDHYERVPEQWCCLF